MIVQHEIILPAFQRGSHLITDIILNELELPERGLLHLFIQHTSAGICLNESYDPQVRFDFDEALNRMVPDGASYFKHTMEGPDDMPAHVKHAMVGHAVSIPISESQLKMGTWQGIWLCEFRNSGGRRKLIATITS